MQNVESLSVELEKPKVKKVAWQMKKNIQDETKVLAAPDDLDLLLSDAGDPFENMDSPNPEPSNNILEETTRLKQLLDEKEQEIKQLKKKLKEEIPLPKGIGFTSDPAAAKIVEMSRKIRDLTAELESEKTKTRQTKFRMIELEKRLNAETLRKNSEIANSLQNGETSLRKDNAKVFVEELQDKLQHVNAKLAESRNNYQSLKKELQLAHKVLIQEVGDEAKMRMALKGGSWKGRAQQIIALQNKLAEMKMLLEQNEAMNTARTLDGINDDSKSSTYRNGSLTESFQGSLISTLDRKHLEQIKRQEKENKDDRHTLLTEVQVLETANKDLKQKYEAAKARNNVLRDELQVLKSKMDALMEKGDHDDELVGTLTENLTQLQQTFIKLRSGHPCEGSFESPAAELASLKKRHEEDTQSFRAVINDREQQLVSLKNEIRILQENKLKSFVDKQPPRSNRQYSSVKKSKHGDIPFGVNSPNSAPLLRPEHKLSEVFHVPRRHVRSSDSVLESIFRENSPDNVDAQLKYEELSELRAMCHEYRIVSQAAQVEKEKLLELVRVLNKRLDEFQTRAIQAEQHKCQLQQANVQLEKELGKAALQGNKSKNTSKQSARVFGPSNVSAKFENNVQDEDTTRLKGLKEENDFLKTSLENLMSSKEDDLKTYQNILEDTRRIFLDGLYQFRQSKQDNKT